VVRKAPELLMSMNKSGEKGLCFSQHCRFDLCQQKNFLSLIASICSELMIYCTGIRVMCGWLGYVETT
jgi:hypothetical protein